MLIYAGIGSRSTPDPICESMSSIAQRLAPYWKLRSGHADGADTAFELGVLTWAQKYRKQPNMEIFLPWPGFNSAPTNSPHYLCVEANPEALRVAAAFHPAWHRCSPAAKYLHVRNVYQIAGRDMLTPVDMVVCWTPRGKREGGTGQALRIAEYLQIPIFDLALSADQQKLCDFIDQKENAHARTQPALRKVS